MSNLEVGSWQFPMHACIGFTCLSLDKLVLPKKSCCCAVHLHLIPLLSSWKWISMFCRRTAPMVRSWIHCSMCVQVVAFSPTSPSLRNVQSTEQTRIQSLPIWKTNSPIPMMTPPPSCRTPSFWFGVPSAGRMCPGTLRNSLLGQRESPLKDTAKSSPPLTSSLTFKDSWD